LERKCGSSTLETCWLFLTNKTPRLPSLKQNGLWLWKAVGKHLSISHPRGRTGAPPSPPPPPRALQRHRFPSPSRHPPSSAATAAPARLSHRRPDPPTAVPPPHRRPPHEWRLPDSAQAAIYKELDPIARLPSLPSRQHPSLPFLHAKRQP
jgi:hypothetical protein